MAKLHPSTSENIKQTPTKHIIIHCKNLSGGHLNQTSPPHVFCFLGTWWTCVLHSLRSLRNPPKSAPRRCGAKWGWPKPSDCRRRWRASNCPASPSRHDRRCWPRQKCCQVAMDAMDMDGDVREMIWWDTMLQTVAWNQWVVLKSLFPFLFNIWFLPDMAVVDHLRTPCFVLRSSGNNPQSLALEAEAFGHTHRDRPKGRKVFPGCYRLYRSIDISIYI